MQPGVILSFDTSGPFCDVALLRGESVVAEGHVDMARGQGERLMPMIADLMAEARVARRDLLAIGVGTGPGNFTGLRISVAAARGLSLGLSIPAIGVTGFEAIIEAEGLYGGRVLITLPAPRECVYAQMFVDGRPAQKPALTDLNALPSGVDLVIGPGAVEAEKLDAEGQVDLPTRLAASIARLAQRRLGSDQPRPAPLYLKPPDAAPAAQTAPTILP